MVVGVDSSEILFDDGNRQKRKRQIEIEINRNRQSLMTIMKLDTTIILHD